MKKKISIITATYNSGSFLIHLINSLAAQITPDVEFIVIDGGSEDETLAIVKKNEQYISYWLSEKDDGIYDAWNKGIEVCSGDWIMFIGADDILMPNAIHEYLKHIEELGGEYYDLILSKLKYVDEAGNLLRIVGEPWNWDKFKMSKMSFAHCGMLTNKFFFEKNGLFDKSFKICGDSEILLRAKGEVLSSFLDKVTVVMRRGGISYSIKAIMETYKTREKNKIIPKYLNMYRFVRLLFFFYMSKFKI